MLHISLLELCALILVGLGGVWCAKSEGTNSVLAALIGLATALAVVILTK